METFYLIDFTHGVQPKNRLQREVAKLLFSYHRRCIAEYDLRGVFAEIDNAVAKLCGTNPRCRAESGVLWEGVIYNGDYRYDFPFCHLLFMKYEVVAESKVNGRDLVACMDRSENLTKTE